MLYCPMYSIRGAALPVLRIQLKDVVPVRRLVRNCALWQGRFRAKGLN